MRLQALRNVEPALRVSITQTPLKKPKSQKPLTLVQSKQNLGFTSMANWEAARGLSRARLGSFEGFSSSAKAYFFAEVSVYNVGP